MNKINKFFNEDITLTKGVFFSLLLSFLFVFPLFHANVYYEDDLFRIFTGQYVWEMLGRVITYWLMHIITFSGEPMLNVTPLPLLLSFLVISHLIFYVAKNILKSLTIANILIAFCFVCNPYLLANLSYAYDCLHMVLGFHFSVIAYVKITQKKYMLSILGLLLGFLLYQPMGNVFLSLAFFSIIQNLYIGKTIKYSLTLFVRILLLYIITILCYLIFIKIFYLITPHEFQRSEQLSLLHLITGVFYERVGGLIEYISVLYKNSEAKYLLLLYALFGVLSIFLLKNLVKIIIVFLSILGAFLSIFGPMFLLKEGLITARVLTSLGVLILTLLYLNYQAFFSKKIIKYFSLFIICALSWYHITLSFGYGNHLSLQRKYDEKLLAMVQMDVLALQDRNEKITDRWVSLEGCSQIPKSVQLLEKLRPFYSQLNAKACTWRAKFIIFDEMLGNFKFDRRWNGDYPEIKKKICKEKISPTVTRELYTIYSHKEFIFIKLGKNIKCE